MVLDEEQHKRAKECIYNIQDKIYAIASELNNQKAYKEYIKEKINSIEWDFTCLKSICEVD